MEVAPGEPRPDAVRAVVLGDRPWMGLYPSQRKSQGSWESREVPGDRQDSSWYCVLGRVIWLPSRGWLLFLALQWRGGAGMCVMEALAALPIG